MRAILVMFFICSILLGTALEAKIGSLSVDGDGPSMIPAMLPPASSHFDYVLIIVMENHAFGNINGNSSAPFLNQLV